MYLRAASGFKYIFSTSNSSWCTGMLDISGGDRSRYFLELFIVVGNPVRAAAVSTNRCILPSKVVELSNGIICNYFPIH